MSFESGSISFRMFYGPSELPTDFAERFAAHAATGLEAVQAEQSAGWVTGRHLLDRNITEESISYAGYLRLALRLAQRKVPTAILQAECRMEEMAAASADGRNFVNRRQRAEIRQAVMERLLPAQSPVLTGIPLVHQPGTDVYYAGAVSDRQCDLLCARFLQTTGRNLVAVSPETVAMKLHNLDMHDLMPVSFSKDVDDALMEITPGRDFLTWLWFVAEKGRGSITVPDVGTVGVLLEGPLTFKHDGSGAHVSVLKNGEPVGSAEAKACLGAGKKLARARLTFGRGNELWKCTFSADDFVIRSLTVPEEEGNLDPASRFQSRMTQIDRFMGILTGAYDEFLGRRIDNCLWPEIKKGMRDWVMARSARA